MPTSLKAYERYVTNMIQHECTTMIKNDDCKHTKMIYIHCMNQTNDNARYCTNRAQLLNICCKQPDSAELELAEVKTK